MRDQELYPRTLGVTPPKELLAGPLSSSVPEVRVIAP
jgi:hypothetical protein